MPGRPIPPVIALLSTLLLVTIQPAVEAETTALDRINELVGRYGGLLRYHDRGELERRVMANGEVRERQRFVFETVRDGDRFLFSLREEGGTRELLLWRAGPELLAYDSATAESHPVPTTTSGLVQLLDLDDSSAEVFLVPRLLAEPHLPHFDLTSAELAETGACGTLLCERVVAKHRGDLVTSTMAIDAEKGLIRSLRVEVSSPDDVVARALAEAGLAARPRPEAARSLEATVYEARMLEIDLDPPETLVSEPSFSAGAETAPEDGGRAASTPADGGRLFSERIEVVETSVRLRVVDRQGRPVPGLDPSSFLAKAGGRELEVTAVDWISSQTPFGHDIPPEIRARYDIVVPGPGKLVVFFVQSGMISSRARGHLQILPRSRTLLEELDRDDWVAVTSFDSHLKLRQDFTRDRESVADALSTAVRHGKAEPPTAGRFPSLGRYLDPREARDAASPERALELVAEALVPFEQEKVVVYVGWGLGELSGGFVHMTAEYGRARDALARANASVFVLDITQADYHSLEIGLQQVAEETGGTYEKTFKQPDVAAKLLSRAVEGHYLVTVAVPGDLDSRRRLRIQLHDVKGTILMPDTYVGERSR